MISKIWTSNIKNGIFGGLFPVIDPFEKNWLYVGDGWGSSFASMKLRKFSLCTGEEIQSVSIKNNVRCLTFNANQIDLFAVTNNKIFQVNRNTLEVYKKFEKGIQQYNDYVVSDDQDSLLMMNHRTESLFIYNYINEKGFKKKIGPCSGIFKKTDQEYYIFSGYKGKIALYNLKENSVTDILSTDVFHSGKVYNSNIAFLRLGYIEYGEGKSWHITPMNKIRVVDIRDLNNSEDLDIGFDFHSFTVDNGVIYLWSQNNFWTYSVDSKELIYKLSIREDEYIMQVLSDRGKILTESNTGDRGRTFNCYEFNP